MRKERVHGGRKCARTNGTRSGIHSRLRGSSSFSCSVFIPHLPYQISWGVMSTAKERGACQSVQCTTSFEGCQTRSRTKNHFVWLCNKGKLVSMVSFRSSSAAAAFCAAALCVMRVSTFQTPCCVVAHCTSSMLCTLTGDYVKVVVGAGPG